MRAVTAERRVNLLTMRAPVVVTGGAGFLGSHLVGGSGRTESVVPRRSDYHLTHGRGERLFATRGRIS